MIMTKKNNVHHSYQCLHHHEYNKKNILMTIMLIFFFNRCVSALSYLPHLKANGLIFVTIINNRTVTMINLLIITMISFITTFDLTALHGTHQVENFAWSQLLWICIQQVCQCFIFFFFADCSLMIATLK